MTYAELLSHLQQLTPEQLSQQAYILLSTDQGPDRIVTGIDITDSDMYELQQDNPEAGWVGTDYFQQAELHGRVPVMNKGTVLLATKYVDE